jgi:magnesium transporter
MPGAAGALQQPAPRDLGPARAAAPAAASAPRGGAPSRTETAMTRATLPAVPAVDGAEAMVGIVTADAAMDVAQAAATEDFQKAGGTGAGLADGLRRAGVALLYRKRAGWLVALVFANILSGAGIAAFEDTIAAHLALVFFLPLLIASAGNAGSQAATLTVRALATGEVGLSDRGRLLGREVLVALALGGTMAAAVSLIGLWRGGPEIALVVALAMVVLAMVVVVLAGSLIGMSLPFLLDRLRLDPASAGAPLVTSTADVAGVLVYFAIASAVLIR